MSVFEAAELMASARTDAGLVESAEGNLIGILTDTDVSIKIIASGRSLRRTTVGEAMTANPLCIRETERADRALAMMAEKRARHLPLLDAEGSRMLGMLDIAKVLYDAITRLEKTRDASANFYFPAMNRLVLGLSSSSAADGAGGVPTLRDALENRPPPATAAPHDPIDVAFEGLRRTRRSVLVLDDHDGKLVGILSKSDVAKRALRTVGGSAAVGSGASSRKRSSGKHADEEDSDPELRALKRLAVRDVMTPRPDFISIERTVLDALHKMLEGKYANLPVLDDDGEPVGVVDVLDLLSASMGGPSEKKSSDPTTSSRRRAGAAANASLLENFFSANGGKATTTPAAAKEAPKKKTNTPNNVVPEVERGPKAKEEEEDEATTAKKKKGLSLDDDEEGEPPSDEETATIELDAVVVAKPVPHDDFEETGHILPSRASVNCAISPSTLKHSKPRVRDAGVVPPPNFIGRRPGDFRYDVLRKKRGATLYGNDVFVSAPGGARFADLADAVADALLPSGRQTPQFDLVYDDGAGCRVTVVDDATLRAASHLALARAGEKQKLGGGRRDTSASQKENDAYVVTLELANVRGGKSGAATVSVLLAAAAALAATAVVLVGKARRSSL